MLTNDTVQPKLCEKKVFTVLCFFLVVMMLFSTVASAASWSHYDSQRDAIVFDYTDAVDFMSSNNFYMEVTFVKNNIVNVRRFTSLSGYYYATENGFHTVRFYRPDGTQYLTNYQTSINQINSGTWNDGAGYFGYDGTTGNTGTDPNGGGGGSDPEPDLDPDPPDEDPPPYPGPGQTNWTSYDQYADAGIFEYSQELIDYLNYTNGYLHVELEKEDGSKYQRTYYAPLSGTFYAKENGTYTFSFFEGNGETISIHLNRTVSQIENENSDQGLDYFGYDGNDNIGTGDSVGSGGGSDPDPPPSKTEETFNYGSVVGDWINSGDYMNVTYQDQYGNNHGTKSYRNLSGYYDMTANGTYTYEFFNSDGSRYGDPVTRTVNDLDEDTIQNGQGTFGYDQSGDNGDDQGCGCWFQAPAWNEYMGKLDEIKNAIPPPPNWNAVADTFYERIVPRAINDLQNMLGTAPPPPSSPTIIEPINLPEPNKPTIADYAEKLEQNTPQMQSNPELDNATFSADDVREQAPEIEFREDESGGFELTSSNPVDSLPELPFEDFPMPGMGDAGEWDHQPLMGDNPFPMPSENSSGGGSLDPGAPPIPSGGSNEPPVPGSDGGGNDVPVPGQEYNPPMPSGGFEMPGGGNYKLHPDDPDGSG